MGRVFQPGRDTTGREQRQHGYVEDLGFQLLIFRVGLLLRWGGLGGLPLGVRLGRPLETTCWCLSPFGSWATANHCGEQQNECRNSHLRDVSSMTVGKTERLPGCWRKRILSKPGKDALRTKEKRTCVGRATDSRTRCVVSKGTRTMAAGTGSHTAVSLLGGNFSLHTEAEQRETSDGGRVAG